MGRRIVSGISGTSGLGTLTVSSSTISTVQSNSDLTLDPNGTGGVVIVGDVTIADQGDLRLREGSAGGTNYIAMQAASTMASNYTVTWPAAVASSSGYVLSSDSSGNLSWVAQTAAGVTVSDAGSSGSTHYPYFGTTTSGAVTSFNYRSNISFVPSTGELTSTIGSFANIYGGTSTSGTITIRGTSSGTKATASVLMTDNVSSSSTTTGTLVVTGGIGASGSVYAGNFTTAGTLTAGTITETSSITLKENVNPINNALDAMLQLVGVTYDRKDGSSVDEAGLIAEEVYKILPNLVQLDENGKPYGIKYTKLGAYLLESIKTLKKEIDQIKGTK